MVLQVVASPQIGFAQEVVASAPPPYSEYAQPQVNGVIRVNVTEKYSAIHILLLHVILFFYYYSNSF